jgi:hypothetical protein
MSYLHKVLVQSEGSFAFSVKKRGGGKRDTNTIKVTRIGGING